MLPGVVGGKELCNFVVLSCPATPSLSVAVVVFYICHFSVFLYICIYSLAASHFERKMWFLDTIQSVIILPLALSKHLIQYQNFIFLFKSLSCTQSVNFITDGFPIISIH